MLRLLGRLLARLLFKVEIHGEFPLQKPERLVIIANHQSFLDPILAGAFLPFDLTWIVHSTIASRWYFKPFLRLADHVVVDAANPLGMKALVHVIESGRPVMIFPEGRITVTGSLMKVYDGLSFLIVRTGATLLPICIDGAVHSYFSRMSYPFPIRWRPRVRVTIYPCEQMPVPAARTARERRRSASRWVRRRLEEIWFQSQPKKPLFQAFLDAMDMVGPETEILEDIRFQPQSFRQVLRGALALGRLVARHSAEGEAVGVLMPNAAPAVMLLFGMFAMRRVPAVLNYSSGVEGMQNAIDVARLKTVFASRTFIEKARLGEKVAQLKGARILYLEDLRAQFSILDKLWLILYALRHPRRVMRKTSPEDPAVILFTSGSEGKPKGVVLSHASIMANVCQTRAIIEFSNEEKFLTALPLFHCFGLTVGLLVPIVTGARIFLYPSPLHYRLVPEMAYDRDCTVLLATPTFLAHYGRFADPYDFYNIKYIIAGAEKLTGEVRELWNDKFGIRIIEGYGATELSPIVAANTPFFYRSGTVGRFLPGVEWRLEAVPGIERGGLLHLRGPNMMLGYLLHDQPGVIRPPESSQGAGWYNTGDLVDVDEEGFVTIIGRMKRFAKIAGEMVSLEAVELVARWASPARAHAAVNLPHPRRGETILLFTEDASLTRERLLSAAREHGIAELAVARQVVCLQKIPRLGSGKFDYVKLKELAAQPQPASPVEELP